MLDQKQRSCLFVDTNIALSHALRLNKDGIKTFYSCPDIYYSGDVLFANQITAEGFPLEKVTEPSLVIDKVGMVMFPDHLNGAQADSLRADGRAVFGPSFEWTEIENKRAYGLNRLKKMGVAISDFEVAYGLEEAKEILDTMLKDHDFAVIKIDKCKGNLYTFKAHSITELEVMFHQGGFGPYVEDVEIVLQVPAPGIEIGCDVLFNGEDFILPYLFTVDCIGKWVQTSGWNSFLLDKIKPYLQESDYRGNVSFEGFWDGEELLITDGTFRIPLPFGNIYTVALENYGEVIWAVANKLPAKNDILYRYNFMLYLFSANEKQWRPLYVPEKYLDRITFRRAVKYEKVLFYIPGDDLIASIVGSGDDVQFAIEEAYKIYDEMDIADSYFDGGQIRGVLKHIAELDKLESDLFHFGNAGVEKGGGGSGNFGHEGRPGEVGGSESGGGLSDRAARAKESYKPATAQIQQAGEANEGKLASAIKGQALPDNEPFDVVKGTYAIEVKTIVRGGNDKITMHPDSLKRKVEAAKNSGLSAHTVVFDNRSKQIYYKAGLGSFRLANMIPVNLKDLKEMFA